MKKEEFKLLSNEEKVKVVEGLDYLVDRDEIIELLSHCDLETLNAKLLNELGRAYNNNAEYETAIIILDMVEEEERDAWWYYRMGLAYCELAENLQNDFETKAKNALVMLNKAVRLSEGEGVTKECVELICYSRAFDKFLENYKEVYPNIAEKYFEYKDRKGEGELKMEKEKIYKKITIEDIKKIDDSWDICEPLWFIINIYEGYEDYIKSAENFTLEQRYLFAITWYFAEVNNGGHHQFFYNSTGIVWEDVLNGFKHFKMPEFAANFRKVIDYCGGSISLDREERWNMLESLEEKNKEEFFEVLDEADDFIYNYEGEGNELNYIKAHPEKFVFEGEYEGF
ncbi:DMP19 family protein [Treponema sp. OMZ 788]|uniref:DMP19 family protein n=1 Tax=Treponema sp. OMZ 788 TaxID=2563664 RepID=UPI0020A27D49|nr:DMP19 family protein [Treponema sp. OMZ 788]UTC64613.1 DMP19 family protein [Treponema sp. OMZ 788]